MQAFLKGTSVSTKPQFTKDRAIPTGSSGETKKVKPVPWVEKYRPKCVDEVAFQEEVVAVLKKSLEGADIVILDEADSMTSAAQAALRRTMEKESKTTRFCLICNYVSRIIEPLTSRCSKFRFKPLSDKIQRERLLDIAEKENVKISHEVIAYLVKVSEGDLRKAITFLQSATRLTGGKEVMRDVITDIAGVIPATTIDGIFTACQSGSFDKLEAVVKDLIDEGQAAVQLVNQLHDVVVENEDLSDKQKSIITEKLAEVDKCLADGADEHLQLMSLCATVMQQLTQNC
ncbi:replication factor C (activator 1) 4 [Cricetulus griseus]